VWSISIRIESSVIVSVIVSTGPSPVSNPLSMAFRGIEQSVHCCKSATENNCTALAEPDTNGVRGGISPTAPYQVPGSASGCWQVKDHSSSRGY
jgi:hypothetical protein